MAQGAASVSGKRLFRARFVPRTDGRRRGGDAGSDSLVVAAGVVPCRGWQPRFYSAGAGLAVPPGRCRTWSHNCGVSGTTVYAWEPAAMPRPYNERFVPQESHRARQQTSRGSRPEYRSARLPASRPAARGHGQDLPGGVRGRRAPARAGAVDPCPVGRDRTACRSHAMAGPPQRAVWMPAGMAHAMLARGEVRLHTVYVRPQSCPPEFPGCRAE